MNKYKWDESKNWDDESVPLVNRVVNYRGLRLATAGDAEYLFRDGQTIADAVRGAFWNLGGSDAERGEVINELTEWASSSPFKCLTYVGCNGELVAVFADEAAKTAWKNRALAGRYSVVCSTDYNPWSGHHSTSSGVVVRAALINAEKAAKASRSAQ